ncbi:GSCFA domain-containing protein [Flavobacterium sp. LS1R47]|uniref:GSCFA domain-containing protein n=1 Tax=Flavobacterium frigoritolerans TaxID=2987686 RepID=A0A9X3C046_9FLAO|nr:GSCFA domain-containing protein [Flavobacterium frigoritolerans]MCV9931120.1 GSCFA domain-containing protein [Flavobacterium frigoritolerans]
MQFRTPVPISQSNNPIDYNSKVLSLGSCFAVNMAEKLDYFKFNNSCNPLGILFHPLAIEKLIDFAVLQKKITESDVFFHNERWHSFDVHSDLSNANKEDLIHNLNQIIKKAYQELTEATHVIITYGTSWVYRTNDNKAVVANCHKVPQKQFSKELLSVEIIKESIKNTIDLIASVNPEAKIIFTVSPVRHIKDGFVENQWSKSNLISSLHNTLNTEYGKLQTGYFPSYEIMMDELRDYRFYAEDMLHPNQIAIDYIWERFSENYISKEGILIMKDISEIQKGLSHRSFNPDSEQHRTFLSKLGNKIKRIEEKWPHIKF